jgi:hypothetical protein
MSHRPHTANGPSGPTTYRIRVKGHLAVRWEAWFEAMTITPLANGDSLLTGPVIDQAALHGILKRIRDLGLPLISVEQAESDQPPNLSERSTT